MADRMQLLRRCELEKRAEQITRSKAQRSMGRIRRKRREEAWQTEAKGDSPRASLPVRPGGSPEPLLPRPTGT